MESNQFKDGWVQITTEEYRNLLIDADHNANFPESNVNLKKRIDKCKDEINSLKAELTFYKNANSVAKLYADNLEEYKEKYNYVISKKRWYNFFK